MNLEIFLPVMERSALFRGMQRDEIQKLLACLAPQMEKFAKDEFVLRVGENTDRLCMVLEGNVQIIREDFWGNRNIIAQAVPGQIFAETYALAGDMLEVSVLAGAPAAVLFLEVRRALEACAEICPFHGRLIRNLLSAMAEQNLQLNEKLAHISQRTTRQKLLSYLSAESRRQGSDSFCIPFNRQQLADYLSVERSAMSAELGRMRAEGLLQCRKNAFTLHKPG